MTQPARIPAPRIELIPATQDQEQILANLLELYAHDFSEFVDLDIHESGRYGYKPLPLYWFERDRHPFLIRRNAKLAGVVLVKKGSELSGNTEVWDMAEFFILRGYRKQGIGTHVALEVWNRFRGPWEVRVMHANAPARQFWATAIATFMREPVYPRSIEKDSRRWDLFSFDSKSL